MHQLSNVLDRQNASQGRGDPGENGGGGYEPVGKEVGPADVVIDQSNRSIP